MSTLAQRRQPSIAAEPVSPEVAPSTTTRWCRRASETVQQPPEQLQREVLERQRRPVEQLEQPLVVAELHQGRHRRVAELRRRCRA